MFHVYWAGAAFLTLILITGTIMVLLKWGPRICKVRHHTLPDDDLRYEIRSYEQKVSYA